MKTTIIQIMPCSEELYARCEQHDRFFTQRIVCLALVEEEFDAAEKRRRVVGMVVDGKTISAADQADNFLGYTTEAVGDQQYRRPIK